MPLSASSAHNYREMEDEEDIRPTVVDVYDLAADIGKEFEAIIDQYGPEVLTNLMPRVITTLEQLEKLAEKQESSGATIEELRSTIRVLEHQQIGLNENKKKYVRDLEDIEKDMREEKQELSDRVSRLLDENRKLSTCLARSADNTPSLTDEESSLEPDVCTISRLQDKVEGHKTQLNRLQSELQSKHTENKQLSSQVEHLTQSNKDLRRRARQGTHQIKQLVEERAELHVTLQEHQRSIDQLNQRLGLAAKENFDLATANTSEPCDMSTKLVYDRSDPNRPRFTLTELKDILYQRNELKARVSDLEDELSVYRPPKQQSSHIICPPDDAVKSAQLDLDNMMATLSAAERESLQLGVNSPSPPLDECDGDRPVQGPMPYEPDDAPWKKSPRESGIRKFFRKLFGESGRTTPGGTRSVLSLMRPSFPEF